MGRKPKFKYEEKINAVYEYQEGKCSFNDIAKRIGAHISTVESWWMVYKSQGENGLRETHINKQWSKEIKTTAVLDYLSGQDSLRLICKKYGLTMDKFNVSYQQIYLWVRKYEKKGVDGLLDRRGKAKPENELTELDRLKAENKMLAAKNQELQMEIDIIKKLKEVERRYR